GPRVCRAPHPPARSAVRGIQAAQTTLDLQLRGIEIAQARLDFANESLNTSRATDSRDVVEAQNSLLQAQDRYESATANAQIAILQYLRDTGLLRLNPESGVLGMAMQR
ncbi:MAG TPA: TolC family protein, partial [Tepidisphaeraceae bacterium]|nr:TolC family protein [Tepidisphaeraceae bacterium]